MNDLRAWRLLQAWGYGQGNINQVINVMEMVFGECFVHKEWDGILNAIHAVLDQEEEETTPHTRELFGKLIAHQGLSLPSVGDKCSYLFSKDLLPLVQDDDHFTWSSWSSSTLNQKCEIKPSQSSDNDLRRFDLGVINLTLEKDNDDGAEAGPSKISQK